MSLRPLPTKTDLSEALGNGGEVPPIDHAIRGPVYKTRVDARVVREDERELPRDVLREAFEACRVPRVEGRCTLFRLVREPVVGRTGAASVPAKQKARTKTAHTAVNVGRSYRFFSVRRNMQFFILLLSMCMYRVLLSAKLLNPHDHTCRPPNRGATAVFLPWLFTDFFSWFFKYC